MASIRAISQESFDVSALSALLIDAVVSGASIGFIAPLSPEAAADYWRGVFQAVGAGSLALLGYYDQEQLVGSVQLDCCSKANGLHRGEVQKLLVLQSQRGRGIGTALMTAIEKQAEEMGRWLLFLDTRLGDNAERLYQRLNYTRAGVIPNFASNSGGGYASTVFFYKQLQS